MNSSKKLSAACQGILTYVTCCESILVNLLSYLAGLFLVYALNLLGSTDPLSCSWDEFNHNENGEALKYMTTVCFSNERSQHVHLPVKLVLTTLPVFISRLLNQKFKTKETIKLENNLESLDSKYGIESNQTIEIIKQKIIYTSKIKNKDVGMFFGARILSAVSIAIVYVNIYTNSSMRLLEQDGENAMVNQEKFVPLRLLKYLANNQFQMHKISSSLSLTKVCRVPIPSAFKEQHAEYMSAFHRDESEYYSVVNCFKNLQPYYLLVSAVMELVFMVTLGVHVLALLSFGMAYMFPVHGGEPSPTKTLLANIVTTNSLLKCTAGSDRSLVFYYK